MSEARSYLSRYSPENTNTKTYVTVKACFNPEGEISPEAVIWEDGRSFDIDRVTEVRMAAIPAVKATAEKMRAGFRKPDGSFSYFADHSSQVSQNAPVAIPGTNEGDVNATVIFTYGILNYMFSALDFGAPVPICTREHREKFKALIAEKAKR